MIKSFFKYLEPLWMGTDGKVSVRSSLAIMFSINLVQNLTHAVFRWEAGRALEGLALVLGIEAGLIAALLALTTYQNIAANAAGISTTSVKLETTGPGSADKVVNKVIEKPQDAEETEIIG